MTVELEKELVLFAVAALLCQQVTFVPDLKILRKNMIIIRITVSRTQKRISKIQASVHKLRVFDAYNATLTPK